MTSKAKFTTEYKGMKQKEYIIRKNEWLNKKLEEINRDGSRNNLR